MDAEINTLTQEAFQSANSENVWTTVEHRKEAKKKSRLKKARNSIRIHGEALTIKANSSESYVEVIKQMKNKINPTEVGVQIKGMRCTKTGELLVRLNKGEGQAEKLNSAISEKLGNDLTVRAVTNKQIIDIRDMDEATDETDIMNALQDSTKCNEPNVFKILNIREAYGRTRQALVQLLGNYAATLIKDRKIRIGWVMCRVRPKIQTPKCFRCLQTRSQIERMFRTTKLHSMSGIRIV